MTRTKTSKLTLVKGMEWVGGIVLMPAYVTEEGEPYRPELLLWLRGDGAVVGSALNRPGSSWDEFICESFRHSVTNPSFGEPYTPAQVRTGSETVAKVMRANFPALKVVVAPTPEIDKVAEAMQRDMTSGNRDDLGYLSPLVSPENVAAFFRAAAQLYRAMPWRVVPSDQDIITVSIEALGLAEAALTVIGQMGENHGVVLFASQADFALFCRVAQASRGKPDASMPGHIAINFDRGADLPGRMQKEAVEHGWEVASAAGYPWLMTIDEGGMGRPTTAKDYALAEALALALPLFLLEARAYRQSIKSGRPMRRRVVAPCHWGDVAVDLDVSCAPELDDEISVEGLVCGLQDLDKRCKEEANDTRHEVTGFLLNAFEKGHTGPDLPHTKALSLLLRVAVDAFELSIVSLGVVKLRELLFAIIPSRVSIDASEARPMVEGLRDFYKFLQREGRLSRADGSIRFLDEHAILRLEKELSEESNFGPAKAMVMAAAAAGFDMTSKQGIEAFMAQQMQSSPTPPPKPRSRVGNKKQKKDKNKVRKKK